MVQTAGNLPVPVIGLIHRLAELPEVRSIRLFGSRAIGDAGPRSDIDLAIEAPTATRRQWIDITMMVEDAETLLSIDLVRLEEASPALRARILQEGIVLYD
jgi:predicted nucleotidyltransferase